MQSGSNDNGLLKLIFEIREPKSKVWSLFLHCKVWSHLHLNLSQKSWARQFSWKRDGCRPRNIHIDSVTSDEIGYVQLNFAKLVLRGSYRKGSYVVWPLHNTIMSSVESQKGTITIQRCSVENQKGTITIQRCSCWEPEGFYHCSKMLRWEPEGHYHYSKMLRWEPEGHCHYSKTLCWEPEGHYRCTMSMSIAPLFSTEHCWILIAPFWLSTDNVLKRLPSTKSPYYRALRNMN